MQPSRIATLLLLFAFPVSLRAQDATALNPKLQKRTWLRAPELEAQHKGSAAPDKLASAKARALARSNLGVQPQGVPGTSALNGSDDCSSPDPISGTGTFAFDTSAATTGGPPGLSCLDGVVYKDVWFDWTASASGVATWSLCGSAGFDTVIAVFPGTTCPGPATIITCDDDSSCGVESEVPFLCTAGQHYTLHLAGHGPNDSGAGTFTLSIGPQTGNDDCSAAAQISGAGVFPFDTTSATTGPQVGGCGVLHQDVWFDWIAPSSGVATWSLCGSAGFDSRIKVYSGSGCPVPGTLLVCNDDGCGMESQLQFMAGAGLHYTLEIGGYWAGDAGSGTFSISVGVPPTNDDCATPSALVGTGAFPFDCLNATTGSQGQSEALCTFYGNGLVQHDLWFTWSAPASGCTILDTCGGTGDPKLAIYAGAGCPAAGTCIACNDDECYYNQSRLSFQATAGLTYVIQLGTSPGSMGGPGTLHITQPVPVIANDSCATPSPISGQGVFPFDTTLATTGCEGQYESLCSPWGNDHTLEHDLWFTWTAPTSGFAVCDTCGLTGVDTRIAVYPGSGCPASGTALACIDDSCPGGQSTAVWPCTAGASYALQIGSAPEAAGGPGSFSMSVVAPPSNDSCTTPIWIAGTGSTPFMLYGATTGTQGQSYPCGSYGMYAIQNDIWYVWTAPTTGRCTLSLCAGSNFDSKVAVYSGAGCPTTNNIACNDDYCGFTSQLCFDALGGQTYTIQLGTFPGAGNMHAGTFDITIQPPNPPCTWDDGGTENLLGWSAGGDMVWLNRFGAAGISTVVNDVAVLWGSAYYSGYNPGNGTPTDICIWLDGDSQDGDPSDATLLLQIPATVSLVDTDTYVHFQIAPLTIAGVFFVGSHQVHSGGQYVAPMDQDCPPGGVAWYFGDNSSSSATANLADPGANVQPPFPFDSLGAQVCVRAGCLTGPVDYLCDPGVAGVHACPCANPAVGLMRGCNNSSNTGGASILGAGSNTLATPTLAFSTRDERPSATSVLLQGTGSIAGGTVFGQGVRCAGGSLKRLFAKTAVGGSILAPDFAAGDPAIPARSAQLGDTILAGEYRYYLVYYRDPNVLGSCSALATFNATNTARVHWRP